MAHQGAAGLSKGAVWLNKGAAWLSKGAVWLSKGAAWLFSITSDVLLTPLSVPGHARTLRPDQPKKLGRWRKNWL